MDVCRLQIPSFDSQKKVLCQDPFCSPPRTRAASTRSSEQWLWHTCTEGMLDTLTGQPHQSSLNWQGLLPVTAKGPEPASACSCRGKTGPHQLFPVKPSLELAGLNKYQVCTLFRKDLNKGLYFLSSTDKQKTIPNFSIPTTEHNFL